MKIFLKRAVKTIVPVLLASILGWGFMMFQKVDYEKLKKPFLAPPGWLFPIVWSLLFVTLMIASYTFVKKCEADGDDETKTRGLMIFYIILFINALWTPVFFVFYLKVLSVLIIVVEYFMAVGLFIIFKKKNKLSAYIMLPFMLWLMFAFYLNLTLILIN